MLVDALHRPNVLRRARPMAVPAKRVWTWVGDRRFWAVQALVLLVTGAHYGLEALGHTNPAAGVHDAVVTLYVVPLFYAALAFGWKGAVATGLWCTVLTTPSIWLWHRASGHWLTEVTQVVLMLGVGMLIAWRVDREAYERHRAECTSAGLRLLHTIETRLGHTLELDQRLPEMLEQLRSGAGLATVCLRLEPHQLGAEPRQFQVGPPLLAPVTAFP